MRGGEFNDLAQEWSQLSLYHLWKQKIRPGGPALRTQSLADVGKEEKGSSPFPTGKPLIIISQQFKGDKAQDFAPKERVYPLGLESEDAELLLCSSGFCSVVRSMVNPT